MRLTRKVLAVGLGFGDDKLFRLLGQRPGRPVEQRDKVFPPLDVWRRIAADGSPQSFVGPPS